MSTTNRRRCALATTALIGVTVVGASSLCGQTTLPGALKSIVYRNAPFIMAETYDYFSVQRMDHIMPVNFDGDDSGANNNANATPSSIVDGRPTVYYTVAETGYTSDQGYYFLGYYIYHVNDGGQDFTALGQHVLEPGHEHDMEGVYFVVKKSPYYPLGVVTVALSEAHGALIPTLNREQSLVTPQSPAGGDWGGLIHFWTDSRYGSGRPVVAIRGRTHGTYMAEDCSGASGPTILYPYGMWLNSVENLGVYQACIHEHHHMIVYVPIQEQAEIPSFGLPYAEPLDSSTRDGTHLYRLVNLKDSPLWNHRADPQLLFDGSLVVMDGGPTGYNYFRTSSGSLDANPPWAWYGGRGECPYWLGMGPFCWYTFAVDNTDSWNSAEAWPRSVAGRLLTNPVAEASLRFPWLPQLDAPVRYNAFVPTAGGYDTPPLSVSIAGPTNVAPGEPASWYASVTGGVAPYRYQWSGAVSGTASEVSGSLQVDDYVFLDVWDAAGQHFAATLFVTITAGCPDPTQLVCS